MAKISTRKDDSALRKPVERANAPKRKLDFLAIAKEWRERRKKK